MESYPLSDPFLTHLVAAVCIYLSQDGSFPYGSYNLGMCVCGRRISPVQLRPQQCATLISVYTPAYSISIGDTTCGHCSLCWTSSNSPSVDGGRRLLKVAACQCRLALIGSPCLYRRFVRSPATARRRRLLPNTGALPPAATATFSVMCCSTPAAAGAGGDRPGSPGGGERPPAPPTRPPYIRARHIAPVAAAPARRRHPR